MQLDGWLGYCLYLLRLRLFLLGGGLGLGEDGGEGEEAGEAAREGVGEGAWAVA